MESQSIIQDIAKKLDIVLDTQQEMKGSIKDLQASQQEMRGTQDEMKESIQELRDSVTDVQDSQKEIRESIKDFQVTQQDTLEALHEFSTHVDDRFERVETRLNRVEATMVTKDYLDRKLAEERSDGGMMHRKTDSKVNGVIKELQARQVFDAATSSRLIAAGPFKQPSTPA